MKTALEILNPKIDFSQDGIVDREAIISAMEEYKNQFVSPALIPEGKSLDEITDEDAIEVAKILKPNSDECHNAKDGKYFIKNIWEVTHTFKKYLKLIQFLQFKNYKLPSYYPVPVPEVEQPISDAVEFADWILKNGWTDFDNMGQKEWYKIENTDDNISDFQSSSELYSLFLSEQKRVATN